MQRGLRKFKGIYMVTILDGIKITCACLSGDIILNEMSRRSWQQWFAYWASIGVVLAGIVLINVVSKDVDLYGTSHKVIGGDEECAQTVHSARQPLISKLSSSPGKENGNMGTTQECAQECEKLTLITPKV